MFHIHKWNKWSDVAAYTETWRSIHNPSRKYQVRVTGQYRTCTRCGYVKLRTV